LNIPLSLLSSNAATISFRNQSTVSTDRMVVGMYELTYPRQFNFGGQSRFEFELPASATGQHLVIQQVNTGGVAPVLYDITNGLRITTQLISATQVRVVLPASSVTRKLVLASMASGSIASVDQFVQRRFVNYANANEQGDYIILSNRRLFNDGAGINQVEQYRQYRASAAGGSFRSVVYDVEEIIDQFGWGIKNNAYAIKQFVRFAHRRFTVRPKFLFIIGKGVLLNSYRAAQSTSTIDQLNLVPVYGNPASDNLLASEEGTVTPLIPVGRLNAVNGAEIKAYLDKVRQYERFYDTRSCDAVDELWKKNILHVGGANDAQGDQIMFHLNQYKQVVTDTLLGADVTTLQKTSVATVQNIATENANRLFNEGFLFLNYFGHSSATALEYNLDNPM
ncbi:MAG: C25 family cysteine peptidase, partial [Chitinophagaceae bacterium]